MSELRRIQITHIHPADAHYKNRSRYIGVEGEFEPWNTHFHSGYYAGDFFPDGQNPFSTVFFIAVRYKRI